MRHLLLRFPACFAFFGLSISHGQGVVIDNTTERNVQTVQMSVAGETYAQAFTVGATPKQIRNVSVRMKDTAGAPYEVRLAIREDDGGQPGRVVLESDVLSPFSFQLNRETSLTLQFADPRILDGGTTYWLTVELVSGVAGWVYTDTTNNPTGDGILLDSNRISLDGGETWPREYPQGGIGLLSLRGFEATFTEVTSLEDSGAGTLREAIVAANATFGPASITFHPDLSGETIRLDGQQLTISSEILIDAAALPGGIVLSGDRGNDGHTSDDSRVFLIEFGAIATFDSLIITGGRSPDGELGLFGEKNGGGGISNEGTLLLKRCTVAGNTSGPGSDGDENGSGGGNGREAPPGGGIANYGIATIEESTISHNVTGAGGDAVSPNRTGGDGGSGAGIFSQNSLTIRNSTLTGNVCGPGGLGNLIRPGRGGAGGAIASLGDLVMESCTIVDNAAGDGYDDGIGGDGGGLYWGTSGPSITLINTIIALNRAGAGGENGGTPGEGPDLLRGFGSRGINRDGVNLIGDNSGAENLIEAGFPNANGDLVGSGAAPIDPELGPFEDNGGDTLTFLPLSTSPVSDPTNGFTEAPFPEDQRGEPRLVGAIVDIGAVEGPDYSGIRAARAALEARKAQLSRDIRKFKQKAKLAKRKKQISKFRKFQRRARQLTRILGSL